MLNIYEKAREFKERYRVDIYQQTSAPDYSEQNLAILHAHFEDYSRRVFKLKSEILILENEIELIQNEIDEFLLLYYEKFSEVILASGDFSSSQNYIGEKLSENSEDNILMFEKRSEAYNLQLKNIYRKLAKLCHPDSAGAEFPAAYFSHIQELYKNNNLDELLYIEAKIQENIYSADNNILRKIEKLEVQEKTFKAKLNNLLKQKEDIINSPEYRLFLRYKISEIQGFDFFEKLLYNSTDLK